MQFKWNESKNQGNIKKHGVSFEEAKTVFFDPLTMVSLDQSHAEIESRLIAVGHSTLHRLLLVVHCFRESEEVIRIISARGVTARERTQYEEGL